MRRDKKITERRTGARLKAKRQHTPFMWPSVGFSGEKSFPCGRSFEKRAAPPSWPRGMKGLRLHKILQNEIGKVWGG